MSSKRIKISFASVNNNVRVIGQSELAASNQRIKSAMKGVVRSFEKKETVSKRSASTLVLNA